MLQKAGGRCLYLLCEATGIACLPFIVLQTEIYFSTYHIITAIVCRDMSVQHDDIMLRRMEEADARLRAMFSAK